MLILKVENFDRLGDGGPLHFEAERRGFDFGRDQHLDWTLPDPTRKISGKHCTVLFEKGGYYLYDVSTNGTFVNGSNRRVQSPYELRHGDEMVVGDYVISVAVSGAGVSPPYAAPVETHTPPQPQPSSDLWDAGTHSIAPISRQELMPPQAQPSHGADFLSNVAAPLPSVTHDTPQWDAPPPAPPPAPLARDPWAESQPPQRPPERAAPPPPPSPPPVPVGDDWVAPPTQRSSMNIANIVRDVPFPAPRPAPPAAPQQAAPPRMAEEPRRPPPPPAAPAGPSPEQLRAQFEQEMIRRFAEGANIPAGLLATRNAGDLAFEMGEILRLVCANLMQLLKARAEMKSVVRTAERTMIEARENNALKFTPSAEAALSIMFGQPSAGYLDPRATLDRSFSDLKMHEAATFSAMQQAVIQLFEELSPEAIEQSAGGGNKLGFLGAKSRNWEHFVERWKAKAGGSEHGMLDAFLDEFAAYYDAAIPKRRQ